MYKNYQWGFNYLLDFVYLNPSQIFKAHFSFFFTSLCISARFIQVLVFMQVCSHIVKCYAVASQFESCREKIQEIPAIVKDISRILYYKVGQKDVH